MTLVSKETSSDPLKSLEEWALAAGRYFQSQQTGYVHFYYGGIEQKAQTIPFLENILFVLALLRSRLAEQIREAKGLLKNLLAFQSQQLGIHFGQFPVYLHEYPLCRNPSLSVQLLAPFYWILKEFGHILGSELKKQLEQAISLVLDHSFHVHQVKPFPYSIAVRLAAAQLAYGRLMEHSEWKQTGEKQLERLSQCQLEGWYTTEHLADILVGLQMISDSLLDSPWHLLWQRMEKTWHSHLASYMGPCIREYQEREEPQVNLYDLYGGFFAGRFSRRATILSLHHLHGILIRSSPDKFKAGIMPCLVKGELKQQNWQIVSHPTWAYTVLEKKEIHPPAVNAMHSFFRLIWGDLHRLHSLVCQGGEIEKMRYEEGENSLILFFHLRESFEKENPAKKEIEFFVDFHSDIQFKLDGHSATTFELGQKIEFSFDQYQLSVVFDLIQGEGDFLGHLMRGNRPSQIDRKGEKRFQTYDWTFFLRTIRRQGLCQLRALLTFQNIKKGSPFLENQS